MPFDLRFSLSAPTFSACTFHYKLFQLFFSLFRISHITPNFHAFCTLLFTFYALILCFDAHVDNKKNALHQNTSSLFIDHKLGILTIFLISAYKNKVHSGGYSEASVSKLALKLTAKVGLFIIKELDLLSVR